MRATVRFSNVVVTSDIVKFRTEAQEVPVPVIIAPANGQVVGPGKVIVKLQQQVSSGFEIHYSQDAKLSARKTKRFQVGVYDYQHVGEQITAMGTWYVRVMAMKEGGLTEPSEVVTFEVGDTSGFEDLYINGLPIKAIEDGRVVIYRNGIRYTVLGITTD